MLRADSKHSLSSFKAVGDYRWCILKCWEQMQCAASAALVLLSKSTKYLIFINRILILKSYWYLTGHYYVTE